jgi:hypothetical protein
MTASISHRYRVVPLRAGEFQLGPFAVDVQGQRFETKPVPIRVAASGNARRGGQAVAPAAAQGLRLVVKPGKSEVYVGERLDLGLTLYIGNVRIRDLQYPVIAADGVTLDKFSPPSEGNEVLDGQRYHTVELRTTLTPVRPGSVDLNATMAMHGVEQPAWHNPLFDQFFPAMRNRSRCAPVGAPHRARRRTTGQAGRLHRRGGTLTSRHRQADRARRRRSDHAAHGDQRQRQPGQPQRAGRTGGRALPRLRCPAGEGRGQRRSARPRQVVIPNVVGVHDLPAVRFSFFDPAAHAYRTTPRPTAYGGAAREAGFEVVDVNRPAAEENAANGAATLKISYTSRTRLRVAVRGPHLYQRAWFVLLQLVPVALFTADVHPAPHASRRPASGAFRQAGREARRALAEPERTAGDALLRPVVGAVAAYLSAKFDLPPERWNASAQARLDGKRCDPKCASASARSSKSSSTRYAPSWARRSAARRWSWPRISSTAWGAPA